MKAFEIQEFGVEKLALVERAEPVAGAGEVLVRIKSVSVNYRDLMMINGWYNPRLKMPLVPFSDGAGEVVAVGDGVTKWQIGDRVMPIFMQKWIDGAINGDVARSTLGGDYDGTLREYAVFPADGLVRIPEHLSYDEAATLPCAAVTAWNGLFESTETKSNETVLLQGTGGVSIFGLQFAAATGCRTIITSSSDAKLARAAKHGANELINYKTREDWDKAALEITEKRGVDTVIEVGGAGTLQRSVNAVRTGGHVAVIGVLAGKGEFNPTTVLMKAVRLHGIFVGSRKMFEDLTTFLEKNPQIRPVIDRVFTFGDAREALAHMASGQHFGKIVIKVSE